MEQTPARRFAAWKSVMVVGMGVLLGWVGFWLAGNWPAVGAKLRGDAPNCPWAETLNAGRDAEALVRLWRAFEAELAVEREDPALGAKLLRSPHRAFWIEAGDARGWTGESLLAHLLAEHTWVGGTNPTDMVRPGDIVFDCGAHVGVFTHFALERGSSRVVAIEPDPANIECFRRNFDRELASGRVILVGKAVWNTPGTLLLRESNLNSGMNSLIGAPGNLRIEATTVDLLAAELNLSRVDYIKMDIEGAEREALMGAQTTLRTYRPRLMLDSYHLADDPVVLPRIIRKAYSGYRDTCGPCELEDNGLVPHAIFFHP